MATDREDPRMSEDMISEGSPDREGSEAELVKAYVDRNPAVDNRHPREEDILREEFGEPDADGIYRGVKK